MQKHFNDILSLLSRFLTQQQSGRPKLSRHMEKNQELTKLVGFMVTILCTFAYSRVFLYALNYFYTLKCICTCKHFALPNFLLTLKNAVGERIPHIARQNADGLPFYAGNYLCQRLVKSFFCYL